VDFVRSEFNCSDTNTKNITIDLFEEHIKGLIYNKEDVELSNRKGVT